METVDKTAVKKSIYDCILEGNFIQANTLEKNNAIAHIEVVSIAEKVYSELMQSQGYIKAIDIVEHYNMPSERRAEATNAQFRLYSRKKEYDKAIDWAIKYKLPENEINSVAVKAFNDALDARNVEEAILLKHQYSIPVSAVSTTGLQWFNVFFEQQKYYNAFLLGQEFDVSRKRTLAAGVLWYQQLLQNKEIGKFVAAEEKYNILSEREINQISQLDINNFIALFITTVVKGLLAQNKVEQLTKIIDVTNIIGNQMNNVLLGTLVKQITEEAAGEHNKIIELGRYNEAVRLMECFHLLADDVTLDIKVKVLEATEKAHHMLLVQNNLRAAKFIKDKYELFDKNIIANSLETVFTVTSTFLANALSNGNVADAKTIIKEYNIPKETMQEIVNEVMTKLLRSRRYIEAFNIVREIKPNVSVSEIHTEAISSFEDAYTNGQMELATNIAYHFDIKDNRRIQAAFILWQKQIETGHFDKALEIKKLHKIPGKMTEPVVKEIYSQLLSQKKTEKAIVLRQHYHLNLSIWGWFMELMKKIFA